MTKTRWDKIVTNTELNSIKYKRKKMFITQKERAICLPELINEGWQEYRSSKNSKVVYVKKEKSFDEQFEDKVWGLFADMNFTEMNNDRNFVISYDFKNPDFTQQIDVFAADEETVIVVECKAAEELKEGIFKKQIEAFHGQMDGMRKEILSQYPNRKIKFIWATKNIIVSRADLNKLREWGIAYFNDSVITYYSDLVKHLGTSAKYQLLGNLFAATSIKNMDNKIPAIQGKMGGHLYYSFSIEPERLLKIAYVLHRNEANKNMMPTYQRLIRKKRLQEVQKFVNDGGYFPNSIIISIDTKGKGLQFDSLGAKLENNLSKIGILYLPKQYRSAYIIDGQHRLYGYSDSKYATTNSIPVVAFVDLDRQDQIKLFMDINENQKAVSKTLRVTLNADMLWESKNYNEQRQALRAKIAQMLGEEETSPLFSRVLSGENESSNTKCITIEALQSALKKCQFFTIYDRKNKILKDGTFDLGTNENSCSLFYEFIENCLLYIKKNSEEEWNKGDSNSGVLTMNRGMQAIIRIINDIINKLMEDGEVCPKIDKMDKLVNSVKFYLDPLIEAINRLSLDEKKNLRAFFGGGADTRFWRFFQKAIFDKYNDFNPEGLKEYWDSEKKVFNEDSMKYLRDIENKLKFIIEDKLKSIYADEWLIKGFPKNIYVTAKKEADSQNYDIIINGKKEDTVSVLDYISLEDCKLIVLNGKNWSTLFESILVRAKDKKLVGGREIKTKWIDELYNIFKKLEKPRYSITNDEYEFIKETHLWIMKI